MLTVDDNDNGDGVLRRLMEHALDGGAGDAEEMGRTFMECDGDDLDAESPGPSALEASSLLMLLVVAVTRLVAAQHTEATVTEGWSHRSARCKDTASIPRPRIEPPLAGEE